MLRLVSVMVMFFQPVPMGIERNNKLGVKKEVYGLQGGFRLEKPVGFRASQAAESLRFQLNIWLPLWKLRLVSVMVMFFQCLWV